MKNEKKNESTSSGPESTWSGAESTRSGAESTWSEPESTWSGPESTWSGPESTWSGPESFEKYKNVQSKMALCKIVKGNSRKLTSASSGQRSSVNTFYRVHHLYLPYNLTLRVADW